MATEWYENGKKKLVEHKGDKGYHKVGGPAIIQYYENGQKSLEQWFYQNRFHNEHGPAWIEWDEEGNLKPAFFNPGDEASLVKFNVKERYYLDGYEVTGKAYKVIKELGLKPYTEWNDKDKKLFAKHMVDDLEKPYIIKEKVKVEPKPKRKSKK